MQNKNPDMEMRSTIGFFAFLFIAVAFIGGFAFLPDFTATGNFNLRDAECTRDSAEQITFRIRLYNNGQENIDSLSLELISGAGDVKLQEMQGLPLEPKGSKIVSFRGVGQASTGDYTIKIFNDEVDARATFRCQ